ncbi:hypothetical protein DPEC_G00245430 [Dallia pectoralis]|uniref:Uncharacterized protein n=1 Tax=Dallia pectoralis TaxID=75939 RepID=A0ACC2FWD8_DALPE|nr:hypothetical protein DPEC_G00245430 [Dallia pectoralis]
MKGSAEQSAPPFRVAHVRAEVDSSVLGNGSRDLATVGSPVAPSSRPQSISERNMRIEVESVGFDAR